MFESTEGKYMSLKTLEDLSLFSPVLSFVKHAYVWVFKACFNKYHYFMKLMAFVLIS